MAHLVIKTIAVAAATLVAPTLAQQLTMPAYDPSVGDAAGTPAATAEAIPTPMSEAGGFKPLSALPMTSFDALPLEGNFPAITESSGTWLRRGLWYADVDAVVMARTWDRHGLTMVEEFDAVTNQTIIQVGPVNFNNRITIQSGGLGESSPGYDASARLALGRFLFRDQENRDHTAEMVIFGGAEWSENVAFDAQLDASNGLVLPAGGDQTGLHVPIGIDGSTPLDLDAIDGLASFDRSDEMDIEYASRFHSWEWNYSVAQRMRKDRMELQPSGEWVRRASAGITYEYTAGLRYFDVEERLDWFATNVASIDLTDGDTDGYYDVDTSNNLFGLQFGAGITYDADRWNVTISTKQGFYVNDARATTAVTYTDPDDDATIALNNYSTDLHENGVSYLGTGSILARYHLRPNISLRAGWEFIYVTGLALAPNQVDFNPAAAQLSLTGDAFYHGVSCGSEFYW